MDSYEILLAPTPSFYICTFTFSPSYLPLPTYVPAIFPWMWVESMWAYEMLGGWIGHISKRNERLIDWAAHHHWPSSCCPRRVHTCWCGGVSYGTPGVEPAQLKCPDYQVLLPFADDVISYIDVDLTTWSTWPWSGGGGSREMGVTRRACSGQDCNSPPPMLWRDFWCV